MPWFTPLRTRLYTASNLTKTTRSRLLPLGVVGVLGVALLVAPSCSSTGSAPEPKPEATATLGSNPPAPSQPQPSAKSESPDEIPALEAENTPEGEEAADNGRLPPEVIREVVRQNHARFRKCYEQALGRAPKLAGRVAVRFVIEEDGSVHDVEDNESDLPDAATISCIMGVYENLSFPAPEGGIVTVVYPLVFQPD
jgi:outer membrane biosynthesis protein TonB